MAAESWCSAVVRGWGDKETLKGDRKGTAGAPRRGLHEEEATSYDQCKSDTGVRRDTRLLDLVSLTGVSPTEGNRQTPLMGFKGKLEEQDREEQMRRHPSYLLQREARARLAAGGTFVKREETLQTGLQRQG